MFFLQIDMLAAIEGCRNTWLKWSIAVYHVIKTCIKTATPVLQLPSRSWIFNIFYWNFWRWRIPTQIPEMATAKPSLSHRSQRLPWGGIEVVDQQAADVPIGKRGERSWLVRYPSPHNHGSVENGSLQKWVSFYLGWFSTSMIMAERVPSLKSFNKLT